MNTNKQGNKMLCLTWSSSCLWDEVSAAVSRVSLVTSYTELWISLSARGIWGRGAEKVLWTLLICRDCITWKYSVQLDLYLPVLQTWYLLLLLLFMVSTFHWWPSGQQTLHTVQWNSGLHFLIKSTQGTPAMVDEHEKNILFCFWHCC